MAENSGEQIIEELRQRLEDSAQRKSDKFKVAPIENSIQIKDDQTEKAPTSYNIFENIKKHDAVNLFGSGKKSVNLFQIKPESNSQEAQNIFDLSQKPSVETNEENESKSSQDDKGDDEPRSETLFESEPAVKEMKYEYKNEWVKIIEMSVKKFKNGTAASKEEIYVSLEKHPKQPGILSLIVRNNSTKVISYQALLFKNISKFEHFMGKEDNLKFDAIKQGQSRVGDAQESKREREVVKIQFFTFEQCGEFKKAATDYFSPPSV